MRTRHLANGGNYRGARSELQSGRWIRERKRKRGGKKKERALRCDLYLDIRRNSGKRYFNDFQTRSMEDPRWPSLPLFSTWYMSAGRTRYSVIIRKTNVWLMMIIGYFSNINSFTIIQMTILNNLDKLKCYHIWCTKNCNIFSFDVRTILRFLCILVLLLGKKILQSFCLQHSFGQRYLRNI